ILFFEYNNLEFRVEDIVGGNVSLYVRPNSRPTLNKYEKTIESNSKETATISITNVKKTYSLWYLGVYGLGDEVDYTVYSYSNLICPRNCSNNGICTDGMCTCNEGWVSDDCNTPLINIPA